MHQYFIVISDTHITKYRPHTLINLHLLTALCIKIELLHPDTVLIDVKSNIIFITFCELNWTWTVDPVFYYHLALECSQSLPQFMVYSKFWACFSFMTVTTVIGECKSDIHCNLETFFAFLCNTVLRWHKWRK